MLQELQKNTSQDHIDYQNICAALELIKEVSDSLNTYIKEAEDRYKVLVINENMVGLKHSLLEPHRRFIKQGSLKKITTRFIRNCYFFLFNDILIYSHRKVINAYKLQGLIEIGTCWILSLKDTETIKNAFQIVGPKKTWTFFTDTPEEKKQWMESIDGCIEDLVKIHPDYKKKRGTLNVRKSESFLKWLGFNTDLRDNLEPEDKQLVNSIAQEDHSINQEPETAPLLPPDNQNQQHCSCCIIV